jgi:hypothetical protein
VLASGERRAFERVGDRYNAGRVAFMRIAHLPKHRTWADEADIKVELPERVAREI